MFKFDQRVTLKLTRPQSFTLLHAVILFLVICLTGEMFARSSFVQDYAPYQAYGTNHTQLEIQLTNLDTFTREHGKPDCFIFGSSQAFRDIDPEVFGKAYESNGGEHLTCYNFGITGSQVSTTSILNKILIQKYKPRLVVIGTSFLDYTEGRELQIDDRFKENDWLEYETGKFSVNGWLLENSYAWRFLTLVSYSAPFNMEFIQVLREAHKWDGEIASSGFALSNVGIDPRVPVDQGFVKNLAGELGKFRASERNLSALEQIILDSQAEGAQVLVAEMMYHPALLDLKDNSGNPRINHEKVLAFQKMINDRILGIAQKNNVTFLEFDPHLAVSNRGWYDLYHLNRTGAEIFSAWLGKISVQKIGPLLPPNSTEGNP